MTRHRFGLALATFAVLGCEPGALLDADLPGAAAQRAVTAMSTSLDAATIDEGDSASLDIDLLCFTVDPATTAGTLTIDWETDGTVDDTFTLDAGRPGNGTDCAGGEFVVCDSSDTSNTDDDCLNLLHAFGDNAAGVTITVRATQDASTATQTESITINNLDPVVSLVRAGIAIEGRAQTFTLTTSDPATVSGEIATVVWSWSPATQVGDVTPPAAPPSTVTCTCSSAPDCDDGTNEPACGEAVSVRERRFLDDGDYTTTVMVTDKDGGAATATNGPITVGNAVPAALDISASGVGTLSTNAGAPTEVVEGESYTVSGSFTEDGIDSFAIDWTFGGSPTGTRSGTGIVVRASYPEVGGLVPADILANPGIRWDDDNDTDGSDLVDWTQNLEVTDDDGGSQDEDRFIRVLDVSPAISAFTGGGAVDEGSTLTFTVSAVSGAQVAGFDDLHATARYRWFVDDNDGTPGDDDDLSDGAAGGAQYAISSNCGLLDTTCTVQFLDDDVDSSFHVYVQVNDEDSLTESAHNVVAVSNVVPTITMTVNGASGSGSINEGGTATVSVTVVDPAGSLDGAFDLGIAYDDVDVNTDSGTLAAPGTFADETLVFPNNLDCHSGSPDGTCTITARVCEDGGLICSASATFSLTVQNVVPTADAIAPSGLTLVEGVAFALDGAFSDPGLADDEPYAFAWAWDDNGTGRSESGTSTYAARATGTDVAAVTVPFQNVPAGGLSSVRFRLTVTDADGESDVNDVFSNVRDNAPTISIDSISLAPSSNETATPTVAVDFNAETAADLIDRIVVDWGDGSSTTYRGDCTGITGACVVTAGITGTDDTGASASLAKPSIYADSDSNAATPGITDPFTITVTVWDEDSSSADSGTATVNNVAPTFVSANPDLRPSALIVSEGQAAAFIMTATDAAQPDRPGMIMHVDWDDGSTEDFVVSQTSGNNVIFRAAHVYNNPGSYDATFQWEDKEGADSIVETFPIDVVNIAPAITDLFTTGPVLEASSITTVALVDNRGADTLEYTFNDACDDTVVDDADFVGRTPGDSAVHEHIYDDDGTRAVCVRVCDDDAQPNSCDYGAVEAVILNADPIITSFPSVTLDEGGSVTLTATATDVGDDALTLSFDCTDDGTPDAGGACTYPASGMFTARVTVTDGDGGVATRTTAVRVNNVVPTMALITVSPVDQGQASTFNASGIADPGDPVTLQLDVNDDGVYDLNAPVSGGAASASYAYQGRGTFGARARVCDTDGACSAPTSLAPLVNNVAPVITSLSAPSNAVAGSPVTVAATASDAGNDPLTYTFEYYLGTTLTLTVGPQLSSVATTTFNDSGSYRVDVTANDGAADSAIESASFVVTDLSATVFGTASPNPIDEGGSTTITVTPSGTGPYLVSYDINGDGDFTDAGVDVVDTTPCDGDIADPCDTTASFAQNRAGDIAVRVLVQVTDTGAANAISTAIVAVNILNVAPTLAAIGDETVQDGDTMITAAVGSDVGTLDTLSYSLPSAPAGMTIDGTAGAIAWTPTFLDEGDNEVTVRVTDSDGAFAETSFTVTVTVNTAVSHAPSAPTLIDPDHDLRVDTENPTLTVANAVSPRGTPTYTFCVDDGTTETCMSDVAQGQTTTSVVFDAIDLDEGASYTWWAYANDGVEDGAHSEHGTFIVDAVNEAPPTPDNLSPADGATFLEGTLPTLEARAVIDPDGDAVTYVFEVADTYAFLPADIVAASEPRAVPFFTLPAPLPADVYHWRVRTSDGTLASAWSDDTGFEIEAIVTNAAPGAPGIVGPDGEAVASTAVTLSISAATDPDGDTLSYEIELADNAAFAGATTSGAQAGLTYAASGLAEDTAYFWRARAFDGELFSDWVSASFVVDAANGAPVGLALLAPANGALLQSAPEELVVQSAIDPEGDELTYTFTVASDAGFGDVLVTGTAPAGAGTTTYTLAAGAVTLEAGATYYWRVVASDGDNDVEVTGQFTLYQEHADDDAPPTGGCGCDADGRSGATPVVALVGLMALVGLRRRRR